MRRETSRVSCSLNCAGALRAALSITMPTSALLRAGRLLVPEKITSSMSAARMALWDDSPMTQRSASTRFDLPQPLGPTTPVRPGSIRKSVGSTKDLKPIRRNRLSFIDDLPGTCRRDVSFALRNRTLVQGRGRENQRPSHAFAGTMNRTTVIGNQVGALFQSLLRYKAMIV